MVDNISGRVSDLELRCQARRETYTVVEKNQWEIPANWGECQLLVHGEEGAGFDLVEVNAPTA